MTAQATSSGDATNGGGLPAGSSIRVLWVGNSLSDTPPDFGNYSEGPLPARLEPMLAELGIAMKWSARIQGGAEFRDHQNNAATMEAIGLVDYDIVNLQGYYEGFSDASSYAQAVDRLYRNARDVGSAVLLEEVWTFRGDAGSPQFPAAALAVEEASAALPGSFPVQVMRAWNAVATNPTLSAKLYSDATHQSAAGEYLTTLVYARFYSGRSIQGVNYIHPNAARQLSAQERQQLKDAADSAVTVFYAPAANPTASVRILSPSEGQVFAPGSSLMLQATASDAVQGDLGSRIEWRLADGTVLGIGASFTWAAPTGPQTVIATVTGSDGRSIAVRRTVTVGSGARSPVATSRSITIAYNEPFRQVNLLSNVTDADNNVDWNTLEIGLGAFRGASAAINPRSPGTVDLNYANGFSGCNRVDYRVRDADQQWSNWASILITVSSP